MNEKPVSVTSIINFPEKPWMAAWVVKLMKGEYEAWAAGTEPQEVRQFSQDVGSLVHFYIARALQQETGVGKPMSARILATANRLAAQEEVGQYANQSFLLWQKWWDANENGLTRPHVAKFLAIEDHMTDTEPAITGRCDAVALLDSGGLCIIDWKTGASLHTGDYLEVCAYSLLASHKMGKPVTHGLIVHIPSTGTGFEAIEMTPPAIIMGAAVFLELAQTRAAYFAWEQSCEKYKTRHLKEEK